MEAGCRPACRPDYCWPPRRSNCFRCFPKSHSCAGAGACRSCWESFCWAWACLSVCRYWRAPCSRDCANATRPARPRSGRHSAVSTKRVAGDRSTICRKRLFLRFHRLRAPICHNLAGTAKGVRAEQRPGGIRCTVCVHSAVRRAFGSLWSAPRLHWGCDQPVCLCLSVLLAGRHNQRRDDHAGCCPWADHPRSHVRATGGVFL